MPSARAIPQVPDLLKAYEGEVKGTRKSTADIRRGSGYDVQNGVSAVLYHRQALRDRDLFRATYFDGSQGDQVDDLIQRRYGVDRVTSTAGTGYVNLVRATNAAGGGRIWKGTRFSVSMPGESNTRFYRALNDIDVGTTATTATVPIEAIEKGNEKHFVLNYSDASLRTEDAIWDSTFGVAEISCSMGQDREEDDDYKSRTKRTRLLQRHGFAQDITNRCVAAGAFQVALFASDWSGADHGINRCYVGDAAYETTPGMLRECRLAVDEVRVYGADLVVLGMTRAMLSLDVTLHFWNGATQRVTSQYRDRTIAALTNFLATDSNAFYFSLDAMRGAILRALRAEVQSIDIEAAPAPPSRTNLFDGAQLSHYFITPNTVQVTLAGPT